MSIVLATVLVAVALFAFYAFAPSHPSQPPTLPLSAGRVLAFGPGIPEVLVIPPRPPAASAEYLLTVNFTVSRAAGVLTGAWSFDPPSTLVYACVLPANESGNWGGMLSGCGTSPLHDSLAPGDWTLLFEASAAGNLTVTETLEVT